MATRDYILLKTEYAPSLTDDARHGRPRVKRRSLQAVRVKPLAEELWEHIDTSPSHGYSSRGRSRKES